MPAMDDPHDLGRFISAQETVYDRALAELRAGRKTSHWMWFVFPQIAGLGHSAMAQHYAIASLDEARAYLEHKVLGLRLRDCVAALLAHREKTAREIMGAPDDLKLRSCLTLFAAATSEEQVFADALAAFFDGQPDQATLERIQ